MNDIQYYEKEIKMFCASYPDNAMARTKDGRFVPCSRTRCADCIFKKIDEKSCSTNKVLWFMKEKDDDNG